MPEALSSISADCGDQIIEGSVEDRSGPKKQGFTLGLEQQMELLIEQELVSNRECFIDRRT